MLEVWKNIVAIMLFCDSEYKSETILVSIIFILYIFDSIFK